MPKQSWEDVYAKQERAQEIKIVDSLIAATNAAMNIGDQLLWEEIEEIAERAAKQYDIPDEKCPKCGRETPYVHWVLGQGCPCTAEGYTSEEA